MTLESNISSIRIRNNTIDQGVSSNGVTPTTYTYASHVLIGSPSGGASSSGSSTIQGNDFLSPSSGEDMLSLDNCSCIISGNKFIRGSTIINSYIRNFGSNDQIIVNNIFDQPTVDNSTNETLAINLTSTSQYERNKNQTAYTAIPMSSGSYRIWDTNNRLWSTTSNYSAFYYGNGSSDGGSLFAAQINIDSDSANVGPQRWNAFMLDLTPYLPKGVKILKSLAGFKFTRIGANLNTSTSSTFKTTLWTTAAANPVDGNFATPDSTLANLGGTFPPFLENASANSLSVAYTSGSTQYINSDYSSLNFLTIQSNHIIAELRYTYSTTSTTDTSDALISPLLIKYRWT